MKVGILGGGQLGQMLAAAAHELSVETLVLDQNDLFVCRNVRIVSEEGSS